jgi:hypothetical protein
VAAGVRLARQQQVLLERGRVALGVELGWQLRVVAGDDVEVFFCPESG